MDLVYIQQFESTDINTCFSMHTENLLPLENENMHKWSNKQKTKKQTMGKHLGGWGGEAFGWVGWGSIWVGGVGVVAQLAEYQDEKPGVILTQVWFTDVASFFFSQSQLSVQALMLLIQPHFVHVKNPRQWQSVRKWKYYTHWQEWIALLLRLLHSGEQPKSPERD